MPRTKRTAVSLFLILLALNIVAVGSPPVWADDPNTVIATVGDHEIREKDLDAKVGPQAGFTLRRQTLESMTNDYLIQQAAQHAELSVDDYLKKEYSGESGVTEADAKKFYDQNKRPGSAPFDQIKLRLIELMNRQALLKRLSNYEPVKIMLRAVVNSSGHPALGGKDAPVTIVEFADFQCPFCKKTENTLKELLAKYGDKIRLVHMDFPLPFHQHALDAANAARCANEQGRFWPYRDALFANQTELAPADLKATAKSLGLNSTEFNSCVDKAKYFIQIEADHSEGEKVGVDGTPTFFIDGRSLAGAQPTPKFEEIIDDELATGSTDKSAGESAENQSQSGVCPTTLAYLAPQLPQYDDPDLARMRTSIIETNMSDVMEESTKQGYTLRSAADAALRQAQANHKSLKSAENCLGSHGTDPEQAATALQRGTFDFSNTSVSTSCAKAYVLDYYEWVVNREVAIALACKAHKQ